MDIGHPIGKRSMHPERFREDLARAIQLGFCGSFQERRELALTMYTDGALVVCGGCMCLGLWAKCRGPAS